MSAYFIIYLNVTDPERFAEYVQAVMPVIERRGGRLLAYDNPEPMEGSLVFKQLVLFEWPSRQQFLEYWYSNEYAEVKKLREGASEWQAAIVEGVPSH